MDDLRIEVRTLSPGVACGPAVFAERAPVARERKDIPETDRPAERTALESALARSIDELKGLAAQVGADLGKDKAEIFESHADILDDEEFREDMYRLIDENGYSAAAAAREVAEKNALDMEGLEDEYFRARADDFRDIGRRVVSHVARIETGADVTALNDPFSCGQKQFPAIPSIVVAPSLSPSETVSFHIPNVLGFVVASGGTNSHAAILARSLGIPAVVATADILSRIECGARLVLNLERDTLIIKPCEQTLSLAESAKAAERRRRERLAELACLPAITLCGRRIGLYANAGNMKDLPSIAASNPDGIGLFRTEFLFMEQTVFPTEASQAVHYTRVLDSMNGKPVVFRLLDIGGDKPLPYAPHPKENNPFLGWRGIRYLIDNPDILISQVRAMLTASAASGRKVRIMVPMVCSPSEMRVVRDIVERERSELGGEAMVGMMVETPAAAMTVAAFRGVSDFISVGSNDLTQYTLAADRENELLGDLYSEFHPGVLALMRKAANDARDCGMETGICGEFASTPEGALYLAAMGFDELSMSHGSIPAVKEIIRGIRIDEAERLLDEALAMRSAAETRKLARDFIDQKGLGA